MAGVAEGGGRTCPLCRPLPCPQLCGGSWLLASPGKMGTANPSYLQVGAGPAALRLGRAELAWRGVVTGLVPVAAVGAGPALAACGWREGKWEPLPTLPHPTRASAGLSPGPLPGLASVRLSPSQSPGSCLCYFNFVFPSPDGFPKWFFGGLGHLGAFPWGRPDPAGLRQGTGSSPNPHPRLKGGNSFGVGLSWGCLCSPLEPRQKCKENVAHFPSHCQTSRTCPGGQESSRPALEQGPYSLLLDPVTSDSITVP